MNPRSRDEQCPCVNKTIVLTAIQHGNRAIPVTIIVVNSAETPATGTRLAIEPSAP
jgi:hypothetical protein